MFANWPLLSLIIWLPIVAAVPALMAGEKRPDAARWIALAATVLTFLVSLAMLPNFDSASAAMQLQEKHLWISVLNVHYHLGVDGISVALVLL
ncbi:MAG TPA: NADH-quinone oxidoreductase subunit M, partial [Rhodanobacteraceae bacterium]|nr:NADH-quinone oxidoreductase subunit M [Rhodanobacteraceae bacterium]